MTFKTQLLCGYATLLAKKKILCHTFGKKMTMPSFVNFKHSYLKNIQYNFSRKLLNRTIAHVCNKISDLEEKSQTLKTKIIENTSVI